MKSSVMLILSLVGLILSLVGILVLLITVGVRLASGAPLVWRQSIDTAVALDVASTMVVTSTADSGSGTLRQMLLDAQTGDTITFDASIFPPISPVTITLAGAQLADLDDGSVTIDASNAGVIVDGNALGSGNGLHITSDENVVRGLQIVGFPNAGILVEGANNIIGGDNTAGVAPLGQGNLISGNGGVGVELTGGEAIGNTLSGNYIGVDVSGTLPLSNGSNGLWIRHGASGNSIGSGNVIAHNAGHGVSVSNTGSQGNTITQSSIHSNAWMGIELEDGGNLELPAPVIPAVTIDLVDGGTVSGTACSGCVVEVFTDDEDEGRTYWGSTTADALGDFTFTAHIRGAYVTATATDAAGDTSEFSSPVRCISQHIYLPLLAKS